MKKITLDLLKQCATNLMFEMKEEEYQKLLKDFDVLTLQLALINDLDGVDDQEPMTFPFECHTDYLREDIEGETLPVEDVLKNAKDVIGGQIKLPKVVN